jgi:hypothetical protein
MVRHLNNKIILLHNRDKKIVLFKVVKGKGDCYYRANNFASMFKLTKIRRINKKEYADLFNTYGGKTNG